jgi:hypothetical protein
MATAREEAERLVAAALAAAQFASRAARRNTGASASRRDSGARDTGNDLLEDLTGLANMASRFLGTGGFGGASTAPPPAPEKHHVIANGSEECCVCPVCRAIAAVRDPSPEFAERLATGASDLAAGATSILRAFGEAARRAGRGGDHDERRAVVNAETVAPAGPIADTVDEAAVGGVPATEPDVEPEAEDSSGWPSGANFGNVWQAATRAQDEPITSSAPVATDPSPARVEQPATAKKPMAKKAVAKKAVAKKAVAGAESRSARSPAAAAAAPGRKATAKKATAGKATAKKATASDAAARKTAAKKATAKTTAEKKTGAKKAAVKKTTPGAS